MDKIQYGDGINMGLSLRSPHSLFLTAYCVYSIRPTDIFPNRLRMILKTITFRGVHTS
jgi:hypothetical protein